MTRALIDTSLGVPQTARAYEKMLGQMDHVHVIAPFGTPSRVPNRKFTNGMIEAVGRESNKRWKPSGEMMLRAQE